jgi:hypothetical protein
MGRPELPVQVSAAEAATQRTIAVVGCPCPHPPVAELGVETGDYSAVALEDVYHDANVKTEFVEANCQRFVEVAFFFF